MNKLAKSGKNFCIRFIGANGRTFYPLIFLYFLPVILLNSSPPTGSVNISGALEVGQTLTASNDLNDADGGIATPVSYQWMKNGAPVSLNYIRNGFWASGTFTQPSYVTVSEDGKHIYVAMKSSNAIKFFDRNSSTGTLTSQSAIVDGANGVDGLAGATCIVLSSDGNFAYVTAQTDNSISWFSRNSNIGSLSYVDSIYNTDSGVNALHSAQRVILSPDEAFAYVTSEGDDSVSWYERNASTGALTYSGALRDGVDSVDGLDGAMGITLSSDGNFAYVTGHQEGSLSVFSRDASTGALTHMDTHVNGVGILDFNYEMQFPVDVLLSPDGNHLYVSALQGNAILAFNRDSGTGQLTTFQGVYRDGYEGEGLSGAYGLSISDDGNFIYVTGHYENSVAVYRRDPSTGGLTYENVLRDDFDAEGLQGARSLVISPNGDQLYVTGEDDNAVLSFDLNASSGLMTHSGTVMQGDGGAKGLDGANGIALSADGNHVYVVGFEDHALSWYNRRINTGRLNSFGGSLKDGEFGVDGLNYANSVALSPDGMHVYATGNIDDAVSWYERNASTGDLIFGGVLKDGDNGDTVDGLNGAKQVVLSKDGNHAYVTGSNDNAVSWYERNATTGALSFLGVLKDGVNGVDGLQGSNWLCLTADDLHLYVTGQNEDAVSWYERNATTGALTFGGLLKCLSHGGTVPDLALDGARQVNISSDGKHVYVCAYESDAVSWYERNATSGALSFVGHLKGVSNGGTVNGLDGPSSIVLSANGDFAYASATLDASLSWFSRDSSTGDLTFQGQLTEGSGGVENLLGVNDIVLSPDGKFLYATTFTDDSITWFLVDPHAGALIYNEGNESTYTLTAADARSQIRVKATYTDGANNVESLSSSTATVLNSVPTNLTPVGDLSIDENQPIGTVVGHFSADDADGDELSFVMYNGGQALNNDYFTIDANGTLRTSTVLDYELDGAFSLSVEVKAMDEHGGEVSGSFDVTYNDVNEPPSGSVTISGTPIVGQQLTASDNLSDNDQGGIGSKTYRWYRYGDDYVNSNKLVQNTKYTIGSGVIGEQLVAVVTFGSGDFAETVVSNPTEPVNGPPANLQSTVPITVVENGNLGVVGQIFATDPNGHSITYSLVAGAGGTHNHFFQLESNGTLSLTSMVDYETNPYLNIRVEAKDEQNATTETSLSVTVSNVDEEPTGEVTISGTPEVGETLTVSDTVSDPDGLGSTVYKWYADGVIIMDGAQEASGNSLELSQVLAGSEITAKLEYTDAGGFSGLVESLATSSVNSPPINLRSDLGLSIDEEVPPGTLAGMLDATDLDGDTLSFSLTAGEGDDNNSLFQLDSNGTLTALSTFDYENMSASSIRVQVDDGRGASMEGSFMVEVNNVDEEPVGLVTISGIPMLGETLTVTDNLSDPDGLGAITYGWYKQGDSFSNENRLATGNTYLLGEEAVNYQLVAVAHYTDGGGYAEEVASTSSGLINGPPTGLDDASQISVIENQASDLMVGSLNATDPNGDPITYTLVSGNGDDNNSIFQVATNGDLTILTTLDREIWPSLSIRARAEDGNGGVVESAVSLNVGNIVEDLDGDGTEDYFDEDDDGDGFSDVFEIAYPSDPNDPDSLATQYPYDLEASNDLVMIAGQPHGTVIGKFAAREPDGEEITFSLGSNTDGALLQIDTAGNLMVGTDSSAGQTGVVEILVKASDPWGASVEKEFEVMVFGDASEAISGYLPLEESVEVGTAIGSFATVEEGNGSVQSFEQALVGGRGDSAFEIDADGLLKVAEPLDYETLSTYHVGVRVTDGDGGMRVQYFGINLINESAPILEALEPAVQSSRTITLRGSILDPGCVAGVTEMGFLISDEPILGMEQDGVLKVAAVPGGTADSFESSYEITGGGKIYFRAYGINVEGLSMSLEETYVPSLDFHPHAILNAVSKGDDSGWWESPWFGDFYGDPENGWVYHSAHGWIFLMPSPSNGIWLWFEDFGWLWTSPDIHPFLFSEKKANWFFIGLESPQQNLFFDYENKNWFSRSPLTTNPQK